MKIDHELENEMAAAAEAAGCELLYTEQAGPTLRVVLDHPAGVSHEHCALVSRQISALLDVADFGNRRYVLEVSSPGLDRKLFRAEDFERFQGHLVRVTFTSGESAEKRTVVGRLEAYADDGGGTITVADATHGEQLHIPMPEVLSARLEIEL